MKWLFSIFFLSSLCATLNEPLQVEFLTNYRNDRIHWHLQEPAPPSTLTYSEIYKNVQIWENSLIFKVIHRDLTFLLQGSFGIFGRGDIVQKYPDLPHFHFSTRGWCANAIGYFGYSVNLTDGRLYKVILTPLIGYSGYFEQFHRRGEESLNSFSTRLPQTFRLAWNGFFFGTTFEVIPSNPISLKVGYSYHLMHNRIHTSVQNSDVLFQSIHANSHGNSGQSGWAQIDWNFSKCWKIGFNALIHYFSTRVIDARISQEGRGDFSEKLKLRWTVISAGAQISRQF